MSAPSHLSQSQKSTFGCMSPLPGITTTFLPLGVDGISLCGCLFMLFRQTGHKCQDCN